MTNTIFDESKHIEVVAERLLDYVNNHKDQIKYNKWSQEQKSAYNECCSKYKELYGANVLKKLTDDNLLDFMFSNTSKPKDDRKFNLFNTLANHGGNKGIEYWSNFESMANLITIVGGDWPMGSVGQVIHPEQMGIHCDKNGKWKNWNHNDISYEEALVIGKIVRDALVMYCETVENIMLKPITIESYKLLDNKFQEISEEIENNLKNYFSDNDPRFYLIGSNQNKEWSKLNIYRKKVWIHKYLSMIYAEVFTTFQNFDSYSNILSDLGFAVVKNNNFYAQEGKFVLIQQAMNLHPLEFDKLIHEMLDSTHHIADYIKRELCFSLNK